MGQANQLATLSLHNMDVCLLLMGFAAENEPACTRVQDSCRRFLVKWAAGRPPLLMRENLRVLTCTGLCLLGHGSSMAATVHICTGHTLEMGRG